MTVQPERPVGRLLDFEGDVVIVTGAGAGLGRAYAHLLAACGARVVVNDLGTAPDGRVPPPSGEQGDRAQAVVDEIRSAGGEAVADRHSVAEADDAQALVDTALTQYGRLDAVVNNAGIVRRGEVHALNAADFRAVLDVHLLGSILVTRAAWPHLRERHGRVVFTSSSIGLLGSPSTGPYATAKLALVGLTRSLATAGHGEGIQVNAVAPMAVTRLNRRVMEQIFGSHVDQVTTERVAPVVAYLTHRDCAVTGEVLSAAGGRLARFAFGSGAAVPPLATPEAAQSSIERLWATTPATWWPTLT